MASTRFMERPVRLRHEYDEDDADLESSDQETRDDEQSQSSESNQSHSDPEEGLSFNDISFGALAKAQETFNLKRRKRKLADVIEESKPNNGKEDEEEHSDIGRWPKEARIDTPKRTSKHAPTVESARKPVSRKRIIFEPSPAVKARDPRFDPTVMSANRDRNASEKANKNYSFLTTYQAAEILDLKSQIQKAQDPDVVANLKRQVMSMESKIRNAEARQRENEIRKKHKEQEKESLRTGKKSRPYYLKDAEVRKLANEVRLQAMGTRARDKAEKRRRKREKGKEAKLMPRVRRER
ncbi:uncharacterized protein Z518_01688 [Rhinocladiella mackenziei CBS 650.93]|uniref:rRNA biogenesis protein RRP36 n=1 Tax=Rhinocladiella mackenziei CBS 650.93 TaxID=1442369 RepID=A0A0D2IX69_9EURO|nr:uncharacterized protein Z518_01688 [Rhinocladiella mackenziei CBS 650.93]KIX10604.1 hypothetical protein Z518_01688 [Rhinocladiella mackenziei CBS 650.93]